MNPNKKQKENLAAGIIFPTIVLSNISVLIFAVHLHWDLGAAFTTLLVANLVIMFIIERIWHFKKEWNTNWIEFIRDFGYFGLNGLLDTGVKLAFGYLVIYNAPVARHLPFAVSTVIAILIVELFGYWYHRLGHVQHFLWKIHSIHHVPDKVNLLNNNTVNFLNTVFGTTVKLGPLLLLGFSQEATFVAVSLTTIHSFVVHMNADIKGGWLGAIFFTPEHHRLHHSTLVEEAQNFATLLTFWDRIFGTYLYKEGLVPKEVGVVHPESYPRPNEIIKGFLFPFTKKRLW